MMDDNIKGFLRKKLKKCVSNYISLKNNLDNLINKETNDEKKPSWKNKLKKVDWFKNLNMCIVSFGWSFVFIALFITGIGTAHYLALHTEFKTLPLVIFRFGGFGILLLYIYVFLEAIRNKFYKGGKK